MSEQFRPFIGAQLIPDQTILYVVSNQKIETFRGLLSGKPMDVQHIDENTQVRLESQSWKQKTRRIGDVTVSTKHGSVTYENLKPASKFMRAVNHAKKPIVSEGDPNYSLEIIEVPAPPKDVLDFLSSKRKKVASFLNQESDWKFHCKVGDALPIGAYVLEYAFDYEMMEKHGITRPSVAMPNGGKICSLGDMNNATYPDVLFSYYKEIWEDDWRQGNPYERLVKYLQQFENSPDYPAEGCRILSEMVI